jgi:hypothetical protein
MPTKTKSIFPQKGFAPVLVLILLSVSLASAVYIATLFINEKTPSSSPDKSVATEQSTNAFQAANSGSEAVLKKIYKEDGPADLTALAKATSSTSECTGGVISGSTSTGSYKVSLYDGQGTQLKNCNDSTWRGQVAQLKSEGVSGDTSRGIDVAVAAEPTPGITGGCSASKFGYTMSSNPMDGSSMMSGSTLWGELSIDSRWGSGCKAQKAPDPNARNTFQANKYTNIWGIKKSDVSISVCQMAADDNHECGSNQINSIDNKFGNIHTCFCVKK